MLEIERTYLVKKIPEDLEPYQRLEIKQGYLSGIPSPLRIRQKGDYFELTKKFHKNLNDQSTAEEVNLPLTEGEFLKLWPLANKSLKKTRYLIPLSDQLVAELDVFQGPLWGLVFVEVEFGSREAMLSFIPPDWFGRDITNEEYSANVFLAGRSYSEIKNLLYA